jgi:hypothetical protein
MSVRIIAEEFAAMYRGKIEKMLRQGYTTDEDNAALLNQIMEAAGCLRRVCPEFRPRLFFAACIEGIPPVQHWLEILDSGNPVSPTVEQGRK